MYADDVILLSETLEGLQNCLEKLHKYCEVWGLQVNIKKTKSMIFNNTSNTCKRDFIFGLWCSKHLRNLK
jgi:hypothetical protein